MKLNFPNLRQVSFYLWLHSKIVHEIKKGWSNVLVEGTSEGHNFYN